MDPARRYRQMATRLDASDDAERGTSRNINFALPMHDENETGMLSIMNTMFKAQRYERKGRETEGFKLAVLQWSSAYGVAYSLMMTIAFGMLITRPLPAELPPEDAPFTLKDWRPHSDTLDTLVPLLYYFFAAAACCDSAWGMLICAEWGVRGSTMPANLYEQFVRNLSPDSDDPEMAANSMWAFRFFEPRAVHAGLPTFGLFCKESCCRLFSRALHIGVARSPSWDPFYFVDRTVMSLFFSAICLVYLNNGAVPAAIVLYFYSVLRTRVRVKGQAILTAMFRTLAAAAQADGVEMTEAERQVAHTGVRKSAATKNWDMALKAARLSGRNSGSGALASSMMC